MSGYVHGPERGARVLALSPQLLSYLPGFPELSVDTEQMAETQLYCSNTEIWGIPGTLANLV